MSGSSSSSSSSSSSGGESSSRTSSSSAERRDRGAEASSSAVPHRETSRNSEPKVKEEIDELKFFDPAVREAVINQELYMMGRGARARRDAKPKPSKVPLKERPPAGQTWCTGESLERLRETFAISEDIELVCPSRTDVVTSPPPGHFTLYESFFYYSYLWFPIPEPIVRHFADLGLSFAQALPRSFRHLIGIVVRGYEEGVEVTALHFENLLKWTVKRGEGLPNRYYCSPRKGRAIINDFRSKDDHWDKFFFYVPISDATVPRKYLKKIITSWEPRGR